MLVVYELRAEYAGDEIGAIRLWHMIRDASDRALCGRALRSDAETRPDREWGPTQPFCHTCGALYLRQVP
ncbi:hypothetical protein OG948_47170 (plasmid) [Embleya sp. NBC_00888]|uniref:hypothetical protein n=1 Tax=Embleya sp. NBC_00888 TaxID=2975960 RepID=UPI002F91615F|nr:hypothetical protein OG948_47170 [Embleya sp. NBC_00888]